MKKILRNLGVVVMCCSLWFLLNAQGCTKKIVYSKNFNTQPRKSFYYADKTSVMENTRKLLENLNYSILGYETETGKIVTGWKPVESDSHYLNLFGRKDFGNTDGAYYQLVVDVLPDGPKMKVLVSTTVKTIVGKLETNGIIERRVIEKLDNVMRSPQIEITNVGMEKK